MLVVKLVARIYKSEQSRYSGEDTLAYEVELSDTDNTEKTKCIVKRKALSKYSSDENCACVNFIEVDNKIYFLMETDILIKYADNTFKSVETKTNPEPLKFGECYDPNDPLNLKEGPKGLRIW